MDDDTGSRSGADDSFVVVGEISPAGPHWGVLLTGGVLALLLGVALAAWPGETVTVLAILLAVELIACGCLEAFVAVTGDRGRSRWALAGAGAVSVAAGVLLLVKPLQSLTLVGWVLGLCVLVLGLADLTGALWRSGGWAARGRDRAWRVARGALGTVLGLVLVVNPTWSLGAIVVLACVWLFSYGFLTVVSALLLRSDRRRGTGPFAIGAG